MRHKIVIFLLIFALPIAAHAQADYTIPKKHRVIQENSLQSRNVLVGTKVSDVTFTTLQGETHTLSGLVQQGPVVFVFLSTECPVAQRYAMRLKRMHAEFADKHVTFVGVYSNENDSVEDVKTYLARAEYSFPIVKDTDGSLARHLGATMTPQAHLIDASGVLLYRGSIDDNRYETRIKHHYLKDALVALLDGKPVPVKETAAFGCTIHLPDLPTEKQITYSEHIAPILQKHCQTCHAQDGIAPFAFEDYDDVKAHAAKIAEQTQSRLMPPWKPVHGYGDFKNERRLTDAEIEMIVKWVNAGTPAGPAINDKTTPQSSDTWALGKPDWVTRDLTKSDMLQYGPKVFPRFQIVPTDIGKDVYVRAIDFQLDNKKTVRSITIDIGKIYIKQNVNDVVPNSKMIGTLGTWTPGCASIVLPQGVGCFLPKGSDLIIDIQSPDLTDHQKPNYLRVGLYFSKTPETARLRRTILEATMTNYGDEVSGNPNQQKVVSPHQFLKDVYVFAAYPHTLSDKKDMKVLAVTPTGKRIKMLWIKASDFKWKDIYHYREPIFLPAGSRLEFDVKDDPENKSNRELSDEKAICQFFYVLVSEYDPD